MAEEKFYSLFEKQKQYFETRLRASSAKVRVQKLKALKNWILNHQEEIRAALYKDLNKPEVEADITDILPVLWEIDHACSKLKKWMRPRKVRGKVALTGTSAEIVVEPMGVVLILAPWNFPFNLTVGPLVSAIAAGNAVFIKPSELSPATSTLIQKMTEDLFVPEEAQVCTGDHLVAEALLKLPFNHIFFTGGTGVGKIVMKAAAEHLSAVTLELGGMNPAIVDSDSDLTDAAQKILYGKFLNAGQSCLSVNYVLVDSSVHAGFINILKREYEKMRFDKNTFARIVNRKHFDRIRNLIAGSVQEGAELVAGGAVAEADHYIAPTILDNVPYSAPVLDEEIFGPVLPVLSYGTLEDALAFIRKRNRPLALYIFSCSQETTRKIIRLTTAGTTCVNDTTLQFIHPNLPFGGVNHSGIGKSHGHAGFLAFSNQRSILHQRVGFTGFKLFYPPYNARVRKLVKLLMKYL